MAQSLHIVCPHCDSVNRVPSERLSEGAKCGRCHDPLFQAQPLALDEQRFEAHLQHSGIPLLVDFWAPWCAPCRMMAPAFETAAARLEPHVRLIKVNTEQAQGLGMQYGIRSIPSMLLFKNGQEADRVSGAMDAAQIVAWAQQHL